MRISLTFDPDIQPAKVIEMLVGVDPSQGEDAVRDAFARRVKELQQWPGGIPQWAGEALTVAFQVALQSSRNSSISVKLPDRARMCPKCREEFSPAPEPTPIRGRETGTSRVSRAPRPR